mmetsp:Transcript_25961/g.45906  ORF Transcript_25961/g.45906 Transcript_25961/m.45906 type:complete len:329 (+) Transcript_25961:2478-3464(+)
MLLLGKVERSWLDEIPQALETMRIASHCIDPNADILNFINQHRNGKKRTAPLSIEPYELPSVPALYPPEIAEKVKNLEKQRKEEAEQERSWRAEINGLLDKAWNGEQLSPNCYVTFNLMIKESRGRRLWVNCMNQRRADGKFVLEDAGFERVGELMLALLNECERSKDYTTAKHCIILSQTFHCEATGTHQKLFLQNAILSHTLWNEILFWEKVIQEGIEDEVKQHQSYGLGSGDVGEEAATRLKMIVFGQVSTYIHVMMTFNLHSQFIEGLIESYAEKFELDRHDLRTLMTPFLPNEPNLEGIPDWPENEEKPDVVFSYPEEKSPRG